MGILTQLLIFVGDYAPLVCFLGAILGGEETLILLSIIAAHGYMSIWIILVFFYLGIIVSDMIWYYAGKSELFNWLVRRKLLSRAYFHWGKLLDKATKGNDFRALFLTKFLYGFRLITIMYLSRERIRLRKFIEYSLIVDAIWVGAITTIGWFAGKGVKLANTLSNNLVLTLFIAGIIIIGFTIIMRLIAKKVRIWLEKK